MNRDLLFRFEFESSFCIDSICVRADDFNKALSQLCLILGESSLHHINSIHKIY